MAGVATGSGGLPSNTSFVLVRQALRESQSQSRTSASRETIRCPHCRLNQFITSTHRCRRCHHSVDPEPVFAPPPRQPLIPRAVCPIFHNIDLALPPILLWMRLRSGLSQRQLAIQSGVNRINISMMENGSRMPTAETLDRLARGMGTNAGRIMLAVEYLMNS